MIQVKNLTKHFGPKAAVQDVSFEVKRGEVLGFLGPNGAGKSTTMRMITGYIPPTSGEVWVAGLDMLEKPIEAKRRIGYLPENAPLYSDLTVESFLSFIAEMRGLRGADGKKAVNHAVDTCFLGTVRQQSVDTLSKGFRHRTCLAQAILHDPEILIMDEPTDGLDPNQKHEVRGLIKRMGEEKAIIFSTHILEEVEAACTRAIIISNGSIVANGTPEELKAKADGAGAVRFSLEGVAAAQLREEIGKLAAVRSVQVLSQNAQGLRGLALPYPGRGAELGNELFRYAVERKAVVREISPQEGRLDEVFRKITTSDTP
ncbi:MAG TPA: ABC transporter ATP-binding protein [Verrucomicrobiales bacterium]|nr:ABC transporter ATP-binding protein [Verrucomicrobiales bacterium]